jgi:hypothetical protein
VGRGQVQPVALAGQQLAVDGLLQQGVPKRVGVLAGLHDEHLAVDRLAQARQQLGLAQWRHRREQPLIDPPPGNRRDPQDGLGGRGAIGDPNQQHLAKPRRQRPSQAPGRGGDQLLGEERVALRASEDLLDQLRRGRPDDAAQLLSKLRAREPLQLEVLHPTTAVLLGQPPAHRVDGWQLVAAVGDHQQQPLIPQAAKQVGKQRQRRAVDPLQVLDDHHHRCRLAEPPEQSDQRGEQPGLAGPTGWVWGSGQPVGLAELGQQAGLAHADLTGDQHGRRIACRRPIQRRRKSRQLLGTADEPRAADPSCHAAIFRRGV